MVANIWGVRGRQPPMARGGCGQGLVEMERQALDMDWNGHGMEIGDWDRRWRMKEGRERAGPWEASAVADKSWALRVWEACKKTGFMNRWWWVDSGSCTSTSTCAWMEWSGVEGMEGAIGLGTWKWQSTWEDWSGGAVGGEGWDDGVMGGQKGLVRGQMGWKKGRLGMGG